METEEGKVGEEVKLLTNYFTLLRKKDPSGGTWRLYQYRVDFEPDEDQKSLKKD